MIKLWRHRAGSLLELIFRDGFKSPEGIVRQTQLRYAEPAEIEFYSRKANWDFLPEEKEVLQEISKKAGRVLVIGCGAGREFTLLEKTELYGVDDCLPLLEKAREHFPQVKLAASLDKFSGVGFDSIYVSFHVYNHIQGTNNRLEFLRELSLLCGTNGKIYLFIDTFDLKEATRFSLASKLLKLIWASTYVVWESGDTLRKYNGNHNPQGGMFFYHYFKNDVEVRTELLWSGLKVESKSACWVLSKS